MNKAGYFTPATFRFLRALAKHNNRDWFAAHKTDYEESLRQPYLRLIGDLAAPLAKISPHYVADPKPVGGSLFRIYRDTRFSKEKTPYKTWAGSQYFHRRRRERMGDVPVFYLHLQPGDCFIGAGLWHGQPEAVKRVRDYLVSNPASWKAATRSRAFVRDFELDGDSLTRPPRGYDPEHPLIEDIKRKDFVASASFSDAQACAPDFAKFVIERFKRVAPMVDWLCGALDLEF